MPDDLRKQFETPKCVYTNISKMDEMETTKSEPPVEEDIMKLARFGEIGLIQKLFDGGKADASFRDDTGVTPLHVRITEKHRQASS